MMMRHARQQRRQERESFEQKKVQSDRWFALGLRGAYLVIGLTMLIAVVASYIVLHPANYEQPVIAGALAVLVGDVRLAVAVLRIVAPNGSAGWGSQPRDS